MSSSRVLLRSLLTETKDGEWGKETPFDDSIEMAIIRGTDFDTAKAGLLTGVPIRHIAGKAAIRKKLQPFDILIETAGGSKGKPTGKTTFLRTALFEKTHLPITCASFARFMRVDPKQADPEFVYWYLQFLYSNGVIENHQVQHTGIARFQFTKFADSIEIELPSLSEQKNIASFLGTLDDRIALLRETNTTLEDIAQALFKSWFVDFDPVRAKQEGREPEGMDADTAALFPDSFEESELGLVPKGWRVGKVDTVLTRLPAKVRYTKDQIQTDGVTPIYEQGAGILLGYHEGNAQYQADENDPAFIFGDHTCITHLLCEPFDISQNVIPLKGKDRATLWVYYAVKDKQTFQEYRRHWMELIVKDIVIPSTKICDAFANNVNSYHLKMESNVRQSRTLTTLRDTLLPRLISGQLRLPDAEALIAEATA